MQLLQYNEKVTPRFLGKSDWYVGIEIEVEAPDEGRYYDGLNLREESNTFYFKHDGSLEQGFEVVTQPMPYLKWRNATRKGSSVWNVLDIIDDLKGLDFTAEFNCGMHVHVSNNALGLPNFGRAGRRSTPPVPYVGKIPPAFYWFRRIIHDRVFFDLSGRRSYSHLHEWAMQLPNYYAQPKNVFLQNYGRQEAVNIQTGTTTEVRVFGSTLEEEGIRRNVESVICAVKLSQKLARTKSPLNVNTRQVYCDYAIKHRKYYPNLANYIESNGLRNNFVRIEEVSPSSISHILDMENAREQEYKRQVMMLDIPKIENYCGLTAYRNTVPARLQTFGGFIIEVDKARDMLKKAWQYVQEHNISKECHDVVVDRIRTSILEFEYDGIRLTGSAVTPQGDIDQDVLRAARRRKDRYETMSTGAVFLSPDEIESIWHARELTDLD